jgi:shikimate dehydrogenase
MSSESLGEEAAISGRTRVFCVLGHPIGHSLSPAMQNAALRAMGIDGVYVAFDVAPERLADALRGLQTLGIGGVNCTIPHKESLLSLADEVSEEARFIGAANTLVLRNGRTEAHNTDAPGFLAALRAAGMSPEGKQAVVLGSGGSARAVAVALARCGAKLTLANRTVERAQALAAELNEKLGSGTAGAVALAPEALAERLESAELLVNTTSVGMHPREAEMPPVPEAALHRNLFVYDLIYNPVETRLLRTARERGARGANGAGMLAHQGALALELWTGMKAPAALMERVIRESLSVRAPEQPEPHKQS